MTPEPCLCGASDCRECGPTVPRCLCGRPTTDGECARCDDPGWSDR